MARIPSCGALPFDFEEERTFAEIQLAALFSRHTRSILQAQRDGHLGLVLLALSGDGVRAMADFFQRRAEPPPTVGETSIRFCSPREAAEAFAEFGVWTERDMTPALGQIRFLIVVGSPDRVVVHTLDPHGPQVHVESITEPPQRGARDRPGLN